MKWIIYCFHFHYQHISITYFDSGTISLKVSLLLCTSKLCFDALWKIMLFHIVYQIVLPSNESSSWYCIDHVNIQSSHVLTQLWTLLVKSSVVIISVWPRKLIKLRHFTPSEHCHRSCWVVMLARSLGSTMTPFRKPSEGLHFHLKRNLASISFSVPAKSHWIQWES